MLQGQGGGGGEGNRAVTIISISIETFNEWANYLHTDCMLSKTVCCWNVSILFAGAESNASVTTTPDNSNLELISIYLSL